jgi:hypothetical protein
MKRRSLFQLSLKALKKIIVKKKIKMCKKKYQLKKSMQMKSSPLQKIPQ